MVEIGDSSKAPFDNGLPTKDNLIKKEIPKKIIIHFTTWEKYQFTMYFLIVA